MGKYSVNDQTIYRNYDCWDDRIQRNSKIDCDPLLYGVGVLDGVIL